jgi:DNA-binding NarL/FixJ family response regulator
MNVREMTERIKATHHNAKVLYTSGYTDDAIVRHGVLEAGVEFIQKPYEPAKLLKKIRSVLDG